MLCTDLFCIAYQVLRQLWDRVHELPWNRWKVICWINNVLGMLGFCLITESFVSSNRIDLEQRRETGKHTQIDSFCTFQLWPVNFPVCLSIHSRLTNFLTKNLGNSLQCTGKRGCEQLHAVSSTEDAAKETNRWIIKWLFHNLPRLGIFVVHIRVCHR